MHILLTDLLRCPRCGPEFGLILLGDRIEERRVIEGKLGCPNCRESYPIEEGFLDLRPSPRSELDPEGPPDGGDLSAGAPDREEVVRVGALLGVREGPGYLVLTGDAVRVAPALAEMLEGIEVVAMAPEARAWAESPGVSRMVSEGSLPFAARRLRGVYLGRRVGEEAGERLSGAVAAVGPGSRLVVEGGSPDAASRLEAAGLEVVLDDQGILAAQRTSGSG